MRERLSNTLLGLLFIFLGIGIAGYAFQLWDFNLFFSGWWTLFIIIPSFSSIIKYGFKSSNIIGISIGLVFLLSCQGIIDGETISKLILPFIFIVIGLQILIHSFTTNHIYSKNSSSTYAERKSYCAVFSGKKIQYSEVFKGATIDAIFGGLDIDLRNAIMTEDTVIDCTAIFGGADIYVPSNVKVKISSIPLFGGVGNKTNNNAFDNAPVLYINATCIFGGVDIK